MWKELRLAIRGLLRDRAYSAVALLTLAFGIAANTIIFSIVDGVLLRPLRYRDPGRLVVINEVVRELASTYPRLPVAARHFLEWQERARSFSQMAIAESRRSLLTGKGDPEIVSEARVSHEFLPILGAHVQAGRLFLQAEDQPDRSKVALLSDALWRKRFGGDRSIVGQSIMLDGVPRTVLGVLEAGFHPPAGQPGQIVAMPGRADVYVPIALRREGLDWMGPFNYSAVARLKPGTTIGEAASELQVLQAGIAAHDPDKMHLGALVNGLQEEVTGSARKPLLVLLAAVGAVLLIVCVNLANLALARGAARSRDLAIRRALGAGRAQLVRASLFESLSLSLGGGLLGIALAWAGLRLLVSQAPVDLPRLEEVALDGRILVFVLALSVTTGLLFGLLPAYRATRVQPQDSLRDGSRSATEGPGGRLTRHGLVALETALSAMLLTVAGLLMASFINLVSVDVGYRSAGLVTAPVTLPPKAFTTADSLTAFYTETMGRIARLPGVAGVALISRLPLEGEDWVDLIRRTGDTRPAAELPPVNYRFCSGDYFKTMGIHMVAGRSFSDADRSRRVAVISETTARLLWPHENPVGQTFGRGTAEEKSVEVIGVARDVRVSLDRPPVATLYVPFWSTDDRPSTNIVVRYAGGPGALASPMRQAVWGLNRDVVVGEVRTMEGVLAASVAGRRFQLALTAAFAAAALLLACLGIYGVVSWSVTRRRSEIGIRMALGAGGGSVRRMVVAEAMRPVLAGLAVGLACALGLGTVVASLLVGVSPRDPWTIGAVAVALTGVAAVACYVPVRRATLGDPLRALRYE